MRPESYTVVELGGKHHGMRSLAYKNDSLVLDRKDIAYVLNALRRGNAKDREFAKKMFDTLMSHTHCECCGKRLNYKEDNFHEMHDKTLCYKCWFIMTDIDYLRSEASYKCINSKGELSSLKSVQKAREEWCPRKINYLVNERTLEKCVKKYNELFGKTLKILGTGENLEIVV